MDNITTDLEQSKLIIRDAQVQSKPRTEDIVELHSGHITVRYAMLQYYASTCGYQYILPGSIP